MRSPQFLRRQKAKNASNGRKNQRKRLLHSLVFAVWQYLETILPLVGGLSYAVQDEVYVMVAALLGACISPPCTSEG